MDPLLYERYLALLKGYDIRHSELSAYVKERLLQAKFLRADAAFCLLVLYDQMIIRAYAEPIPISEVPNAISLPAYGPGRYQNDFRKTLEISLELILQEMRARRIEDQSSSHDVLQAINSIWPDLRKLFGWG